MNAPRPGVELRPVELFAGARDHASPAARLAAVRESAGVFREQLLHEANVVYLRSIEIAVEPWPVAWGLQDIPRLTAPFVLLSRRIFIVQYETSVGIRTLLFNPRDAEASAGTPLRRDYTESVLADTLLRPLLERVLAPSPRGIEDAFASTGIHPAQVDYIACDNLQAQDLRRWLGTMGRKGYFPNARLLAMQREWEAARAPLPPQAMLHCPDGLTDIDRPKFILLDGDTRLGDGIALIATPGLTEGNQSLVAKTPDGLLVISGNGIAADNWVPASSDTASLREYAARFGVEAILNSHGHGDAAAQYLSMVQEQVIAGRSPHDSRFANCIPSAEMVSSVILPGLAPTFSFGELEYGSPVIAG